MAKVLNISISKNFKEPMISVNDVDTVAGKAIVNDRYFKDNNNKKCQITLIEIENINYYNKV